MTRAEELTDRLLDGTLADAEWAELESLLADPAAVAGHVALMELEAALRGERAGFDLTDATLACVRAAQAEKTTRAVMAEIATQPAPAWAAREAPRRRSRRWLAPLVGAVAVAAGLVVGLWLGVGRGVLPGPGDLPATDGQEYATLTKSLGEVELLSPSGEVIPVSEGRAVPPGHTLRTVGEDSRARVQLPDLTTVDIEPDSIVRFIPTAGGSGGKPRLFLASGQLTAAVPEKVPERPLVVATGVAEVFAQAGSFIVSSAGPESARVDVKRGKVEVLRTGARTPFPMNTGGAYFQSGLAKVLTEPALRVDRTPDRTLAFPGNHDATFAPNGIDVWVASNRRFTLWTRDGGTADQPWPVRKGFERVAFTRDPAAVVAVNPREEKVLVRDLPDGRERVLFDVRLPEVRLWTVAPGAAWLAFAEPRPNHKKLHVIDGRTRVERFTRELAEGVGGLAASPDGKVLAVGLADPGRGLNAKVVLLDAATGDRLGALPTQRKGLMALAYSADGRHLAVGYNGLVQVWDVRARELVRSITGFERVPTCLAFSPDAKTLAAGTQDGLVWVWSVPGGQPVQRLEVGIRGVRSVAFDRDGKRLLTVANAAPVMLWNLADAPAEPTDVQ